MAIDGFRIFLQPGCAGHVFPFYYGADVPWQGQNSNHLQAPNPGVITYTDINPTLVHDTMPAPVAPGQSSLGGFAQRVTFASNFTDPNDYRQRYVLFDSDHDEQSQVVDGVSGNYPDQIFRAQANAMYQWFTAGTTPAYPVASFAIGDGNTEYFALNSHSQLINWWGVDLNINTVGPKVDNWYGQPDTYKLGWVSARHDGAVWGPLQFINFQRSRIYFDRGV